MDYVFMDETDKALYEACLNHNFVDVEKIIKNKNIFGKVETKSKLSKLSISTILFQQYSVNLTKNEKGNDREILKELLKNSDFIESLKTNEGSSLLSNLINYKRADLLDLLLNKKDGNGNYVVDVNAKDKFECGSFNTALYHAIYNEHFGDLSCLRILLSTRPDLEIELDMVVRCEKVFGLHESEGSLKEIRILDMAKDCPNAVELIEYEIEKKQEDANINANN